MWDNRGLVTTTADDLPDDIAALQAALIAERARAARVEAELAVAKAKASDDQALIAHQRLQIEKLTRQIYGQRSERTVRLLDQIELAFEELESSATEDEVAAERAVAKTTNVPAFARKRPARQPFPEHLPRERVVEPGPTICLCCGSPRLRKLGEGITETLETIPRPALAQALGGVLRFSAFGQPAGQRLCCRRALPNAGPPPIEARAHRNSGWRRVATAAVAIASLVGVLAPANAVSGWSSRARLFAFAVAARGLRKLGEENHRDAGG